MRNDNGEVQLVPAHGIFDRTIRSLRSVHHIRIIAELSQNANFYLELAIRREADSGEDEEARQISSSLVTMNSRCSPSTATAIHLR